MHQLLFPLVALLSFSLAAVHDVDVGRTGLNFVPSILYNVAVGDTVNFHFYPRNHSVAESTFDKPCRPKSGGVDAKPIFSGFVPSSDGVASQMWSIKINSTDPIWLYCSQEQHQHCRNGQSMVINPLNNTDMTIDAYMQAASNANVTSPTVVYGGALVDDDGGQADQGMRASPVSSSGTVPASSMTLSTSTAKSTFTNGVGSIMVNVAWELGLWGLLAVVFIVTL